LLGERRECPLEKIGAFLILPVTGQGPNRYHPNNLPRPAAREFDLLTNIENNATKNVIIAASFRRFRNLPPLFEVCDSLIFTGALYKMLTGHLVCRGVSLAPDSCRLRLIAAHLGSIAGIHRDPLAVGVY
jgi:hypothetical protein